MYNAVNMKMCSKFQQNLNFRSLSYFRSLVLCRFTGYVLAYTYSDFMLFLKRYFKLELCLTQIFFPVAYYVSTQILA